MFKLTKISLVLFFVSLSTITFAQHSFELLESHKRSIPKSSLDAVQASFLKYNKADAGTSFVFSDTTAKLFITTGPEDDMLSYRISGIRNPKIVVRSRSTLHIYFVNTDGDMQHDFRIGSSKAPFPIAPGSSGSIGTSKLLQEQNGKFSGEEITLRAPEAGEYSYFCDVRGHAKGGMWGTIIVVSANTSADEMKKISADTTGEVKHDQGSMHHDMEGMDNMQMEGMKHDTGMMDHSNMEGIDMKTMNGMLLTVPMSQEGSGTSWLPESSPMYMWMTHANDWMLMFHGVIMPRYDHQGGPRGGNKFDAPNMFMVMAEHGIGTDGQFTTHLMMSLDPITEGLKGYPLLLQTGESYQGNKLVDIQHPHDLFDEVSVAYSHRLSERTSAYIYLGYPGEPALGPTVFMHRPSAMSNSNAPLSHHWMDATHITYGVATAGLAFGNWKIEGSYFNGREPDEHRYDFDKIQFNSFSGRLSFNPAKELAFQVSSGLIKDPESDGVDVIRSTASVMFTKNYGNANWWATTAAWGENHEVHSHSLESFLVESQYNFNSWGVFGRGEYVQKTNGELNIIQDPERINDVSAVTLGITRNLIHWNSIDVDLGASGTMNLLPSSLVLLYSEHPVSYEIYLSVHPSLM